MNKIKNNKKAIILSLIMFVLILIILSNAVKAYVALKQIQQTGQLSDFAANNAKGFIYDATPGQIFVLNARNNKTGLVASGSETLYKSAICIFHTQATVVGNGKAILTNVVDIDAPGDVVVYQYKSIEDCSTGEVGHKTENGDTITEIAALTENGSDKKYKVTYTKTVLDLTDEEREDFEKMAFLMNRGINNYDFGPDKGIRNTYTEMTISWYWKDRIKDYIADRGVLDPFFDVDTYTDNDTSTYYKEEGEMAIKAAENILKVSLTKGETTPQIYYGDNNKAYIGPLQVNYEGGTTSIEVQGNSGKFSANWATKNQGSETFNEQTGNIEANQPFYAVVDSSEIEGIDNVNVKVYLNYTKAYKARFALANNKTANMQNIMFFCRQ